MLRLALPQITFTTHTPLEEILLLITKPTPAGMKVSVTVMRTSNSAPVFPLTTFCPFLPPSTQDLQLHPEAFCTALGLQQRESLPGRLLPCRSPVCCPSRVPVEKVEGYCRVCRVCLLGGRRVSKPRDFHYLKFLAYSSQAQGKKKIHL